MLLWINEQVPGVRCTNLKDLSNGVIWCRLMTKLWPGSLATVLVINRPANSNDAQHNYILLEAAFIKVEMPWSFQTRQLIAGHSAELLRMAEAMVTMDNIFKMQMKEQLKTKQSANKSSRSSRILAGELPSVQPPTSSLNLNAPPPPQESLLQASASAATAGAVSAVHTQPTNEEFTSTTIVSEAQRLRQEIHSMFHQQQSAVEAYMAQQEQLVASGGVHTYAALCFCPECIRQRQNAQIAMQTAAEIPEVHEAHETHEPHMAQETHATHEAHETLATHEEPNAPMKEI